MTKPSVPYISALKRASYVSTLRSAPAQPGDGLPRLVADPLVVSDERGWIAATDLTSGAYLNGLFELPQRLWAAPPQAAVVLAWKTYVYRLAQPLAAAWTMAREIPLLSADNVLFQLLPEQPYISVGLRRAASAVLRTSPARMAEGAIVLPDEELQLDFLHRTLIEGHLLPLLELTTATRRISEWALWGQAAAALAYAFADISITAAADANRFTALLPMPALAEDGEDEAAWHDTCCLAFASPTLSACDDCVTGNRARGSTRRLTGHAARILRREPRERAC